jgi:hypothetical protein
VGGVCVLREAEVMSSACSLLCLSSTLGVLLFFCLCGATQAPHTQALWRQSLCLSLLLLLLLLFLLPLFLLL